ncbi:D-aspartate oxidase-like [Diaphorina citri]|uniref:D-aspartate oxidase-like n=1 Tax=Diaphorina citri TaxID=121845 RepID=A0A3Q0IUP8_DIACI|nr:D-aspartate oxidase-like [Diaphorina citri]
MGSNHKVAILGAGIIGLSTALELQRRFPNCDVTVIADKFNMDTTSDGAAGLFEPSPNFMGPDLETTKFKTAGGKVIEKYISSFSELGSEYNTIFNCTGLGARTLCNDMHVIPVRGQTIRIKAPHITNFYKNEYDTYIIPNGFDSLVTLGGTQNFGHVNRCVESTDTESILARTEELLPGVGACGGGQCWVGLRPHRYRVRVECEQTPGGKVNAGVGVVVGRKKRLTDLLLTFNVCHYYYLLFFFLLFLLKIPNNKPF